LDLCPFISFADLDFFGVEQPPPLPKPRSRTESFVLGSSLIDKVTEISLPNPSETGIEGSTSLGSKVLAIQDKMPEPPAATKNEEKVDMIVEKPVDLYKAIFSDDSEDDSMEEPSQEVQISAIISGSSKIDPAQAATTALNRLVAGDFLESLGKELGLKVPEPRLIAADKSTASRSGEDSNFKSRRGLDSPMDNKVEIHWKETEPALLSSNLHLRFALLARRGLRPFQALWSESRQPEILLFQVVWVKNM
jgi:hypothetical protein